ncbi:fumarylacetoacetate hydrolase family protein [Klugiella xanthotipulae]|uniref:2-keto-4-pentenoate hydratase n=1 Tax=Klugiella xanthotipulae TaxID=244735 RepID=A0A543HXL3_9MICO|nr:fumarylacetoacetate hydrolase family protein [Klugiella xanthotipulae]TQM63104.1 2-keto-4-pentenoate hydratase [Klugiella xanthotipulae]
MLSEISPIDCATQRLRLAADRGVPTLPVRDLLGTNLEAAYAVQEVLMSERESPSNPRVGRKVGLTAPAVQKQLGVDQPDFGVLLADMAVQEGATLSPGTLLQPRIEAEVAFVMAHDVWDPSRESVIAAVDYAVAALEIVDSRIAAWDISIVDTVADNASSGLFVLGDRRVPLAEIDTVSVVMTMTDNGETVSEGTGAACLGDPLNALVWVAETAHRLNRPLRAGEVVLSGALGPMVPLRAGSTISASISGLGTVSVTVAPTTESEAR